MEGIYIRADGTPMLLAMRSVAYPRALANDALPPRVCRINPNKCPDREQLAAHGDLEQLRRGWAGGLPRGIAMVAAACSSSPQPASAAMKRVESIIPLTALDVRAFTGILHLMSAAGTCLHVILSSCMPADGKF